MNQPLSFLRPSEPQEAEPKSNVPPWVVLVVDDDPEIHGVTKLVLAGYRFELRPLQLLHAYSKAEAIEMMSAREDIALILLDVIMETEEAGLECVQYIREQLGNSKVRIVLRTGQPGSIPEHELMLRYDINDYKHKTDLTKSRLFTTLTSSLRSYKDILRLQSLSQELSALNDGLEQKVQQRTQELESSNQALRDAYQRIEQQQQALIQSEKLASVGQLAAGVAHEINNPLGYLKGNLEFVQGTLVKLSKAWQQMANEPSLTPECATALAQLEQSYQLNWALSESDDVMAEMHTGLDRIQAIVKELSVFFETNQTQFQQVDFASQVLDAVLMNLQLAGVDPTLIKRNEIQPVELTCAPALLEHAIFCLLQNALESFGRHRQAVELHTAVTNNNLQITIRDRGAGIASDDIHRIFDPFFTTKAAGNHAGLGLTVATNIVKAHGGDLHIRSSLGEGTTAVLEIPIS
ncbi:MULTISPECIES: ATP-binding protein [unclassified Pseudoalteromonas]|uniref:ATP-binding protein n=1 Tax=unclassified Pseudoalteromonas TaxID=194690 RepID=UPI0030148D18